MTAAGENDDAARSGAFEPLRVPVFRRLWTASVLSNFGQLILGVAAAWEMTRLTPSASMVALVQTALMLPLMLVALPAGALADMLDRRVIAMTGLGFSIACACVLTLVAVLGLTTPWLLLAFCTLIGAGVALYGPAWQASIGEQVSPAQLPAAVALGTISYNLARSFGPALGGLIVVAAGAEAAFAVNALCYIPLFLAFLFWRRQHVSSRLPPERIDRAIISGARYVFHARTIRAMLIRAFLFGLVVSATLALAPLIAKDLLGGDASTFGIILGASGVGAVGGALLVTWFRVRVGMGRSLTILLIATALALFVVGLSRSLALTCAGMFVAGATNIVAISLCNISVQMSAPRWAVARAISLFTSSLTGGVAIGSMLWGMAAAAWSVDVAVIVAAVAMLVMPLLWRTLPLPRTHEVPLDPVALPEEPEVALPLTLRSGPIVVELDYRVKADDSRPFYDAMLKVQRARLRNGGFSWSIARDIADPELWTERFHAPTWGDYLRMRDRYTQADVHAQAIAESFIAGAAIKRVRRQLERPFGSVRFRADTPDPRTDPVGYVGPIT